MTEFNLSEKRKTPFDCIPDKKSFYFYPEEDVKEFIKLESILITRLVTGIMSLTEFNEQRNKLAGSKLTEEKL